MFSKNKLNIDIRTDEKLFEEFRKGNNSCFEELYKRYSKNLLFYFYKMLSGNRHKAEDYLHDIFLKIIQKPELFDTSKRFKVWLYSTAYNKCKNSFRTDELRKTELHDMEEIGIETYRSDEALDFKLFFDSLNYELNNMHFENRAIFLLRHNENYSIREISEIIGCPEGTVKSRLYYTIEKLSKKLKHFNPNYEEENND